MKYYGAGITGTVDSCKGNNVNQKLMKIWQTLIPL